VTSSQEKLARSLFCPVFIFDHNFDRCIHQRPDKSDQDGILPIDLKESIRNNIEQNAANRDDHEVVHKFSKIFTNAHWNLP
jgi:hypothetical protein